MKAKKVWRYWCDYCKKGGCRKDAIARHEQSCIRNPNRVCRMCLKAGLAQQKTEDLIKAFRGAEAEGEEKAVVALREAANGCPACMLTAVAKLNVLPDADGPGRWVNWDYKKELAGFWSEQNDRACRDLPA